MIGPLHNKIFMVSNMQHAITITTRFCAFFSLTMVLVSTVTFIISTIDELQMNEMGEVGSLFVEMPVSIMKDHFLF